MRTLLIIEVTHDRPIPSLAQMVAGRAYTINGVRNAEPVASPYDDRKQLTDQGFTLDEIRLGAMEVVR